MSSWLPSGNEQADFADWLLFGQESTQNFNQKCECGTNVTYPNDDTTYMHSTWCLKYKPKPESK